MFYQPSAGDSIYHHPCHHKEDDYCLDCRSYAERFVPAEIQQGILHCRSAICTELSAVIGSYRGAGFQFALRDSVGQIRSSVHARPHRAELERPF